MVEVVSMVKSNNKGDVKQASDGKKTTPKRQTVVAVVAKSPAKDDETVLIGGKSKAEKETTDVSVEKIAGDAEVDDPDEPKFATLEAMLEHERAQAAKEREAMELRLSAEFAKVMQQTLDMFDLKLEQVTPQKQSKQKNVCLHVDAFEEDEAEGVAESEGGEEKKEGDDGRSRVRVGKGRVRPGPRK